jgi:hypothetical protein
MRYPKASREELQAPTGKFRIIEVDLKRAATANYHLGDVETLQAAEEVAKEKASVGKPIYIYDDNCELVVRYGSWH